jgi:Protein of unknown function (DUF2889)
MAELLSPAERALLTGTGDRPNAPSELSEPIDPSAPSLPNAGNYAPHRPLHPKHGPHDPRSQLPVRRANSIRRTTTVDSARPDGALGHVDIDARGRDFQTCADGSTVVLAAANVTAHVDFSTRTLEAIDAGSDLDMRALVGFGVASGFRDRLNEAYPAGKASHSARYQILDDFPTALLVSGYAIGAAGLRPKSTGPRQQYPDLCAGFAVGATILTEEAETSEIPVVTGPAAPPLLDYDGDAFAFHAVDRMRAHGMRRLRCLDLWREGSLVAIENYFRDSHMSPEGIETVVHEYTVHAVFDPRTSMFVSSDATAHTLPWLECPLAAASAARVSGLAAEGLRAFVRADFIGPSTCTHLNDTLRAMEDVPALAAQLPLEQP